MTSSDTPNHAVPPVARRPISYETGIGRIINLCYRAIRASWTPEDDAPVQLRRALEAAGFVNVRKERIDIPIGPWPDDPRWKHVGLMKQDDLLAQADQISLRPLPERNSRRHPGSHRHGQRRQFASRCALRRHLRPETSSCRPASQHGYCRMKGKTGAIKVLCKPLSNEIIWMQEVAFSRMAHVLRLV